VATFANYPLAGGVDERTCPIAICASPLGARRPETDVAFLTAGWDWLAANFWRAVADRVKARDAGQTRRVDSIEVWFAGACLAITLVGLIWSLALACRGVHLIRSKARPSAIPFTTSRERNNYYVGPGPDRRRAGRRPSAISTTSASSSDSGRASTTIASRCHPPPRFRMESSAVGSNEGIPSFSVVRGLKFGGTG
jgi:hypothetical protein